MSKKAYKSQASSSRAVNGGFEGASNGLSGISNVTGFGSSAFGRLAASPLSYVYEPPDLNGISEPNVIVAFKNVQKKDGTTKAKALEDLSAYVDTQSGTGGPEDAVLDAWIKVYPRTSIDTSRRVRQLAHTLQGQFANSCGKRMGKHMSSIVATWLAGLYDNDKSVVRSASDSFTRAFANKEKQNSVWKLYQSSIIEYFKDVVVKETSATLSDERVTSPDDALGKYARVVGSAIMMVATLLESIPEVDVEKSHAFLYNFFNEELLWNLASHSDAFVRRAVYKLLILALTKHKSSLNPSMISTNVLTLGLHTNQAGSALIYARALSTLTKELSEAWTTYYSGSGKKSAQSRLCYFLKKGSQGGPPEFWDEISSVLLSIPSEILINADEIDGVNKSDNSDQSQLRLLEALNDGLNKRDEGHMNRERAWNTYLTTVELVHRTYPEVKRQYLSRTYLIPIIRQYVRPSAEQSRWATAGSYHKNICFRACDLALAGDAHSFHAELQALSGKMIEDIQTSQPEQSKEYTKSQDFIAAETLRWYQMQAYLLKEHKESTLQSLVARNVASEIQCAMTNLENRNGKPYGAAASLEVALRFVPAVVLEDDASRKSMSAFVNTVIPKLILSPSAKYFIRIIDALEGKVETEQAFEKCIDTLQIAPESSLKSNALQSFLSSHYLSHSESLSSIVRSSLRQAVDNDDELSWNLILAAFSNAVAPKDLTHDVLADLMEGLSIAEKAPASLHGLEMTSKQNRSLIKEFSLSKKGTSLISMLLVLAESDDEEVARRAQSLNVLLEEALRADGAGEHAAQSLLDLINDGLTSTRDGSLSIDVLLSQAQKLVEQAPSDELSALASKLMPQESQWTEALEPFFTNVPNPSLAITNSFGGASALISKFPLNRTRETIARDAEGYSQALRISYFAVELSDRTAILRHLDHERTATFYKCLALVLELASDNISISGSVPLWDVLPELESKVLDIVAKMQGFVKSWLQTKPAYPASVLMTQDQLLSEAIGKTVRSYYSARAFSGMTAEVTEHHGPQKAKEETSRLRSVRKSEDVFVGAALLISAHDSKGIRRLCNELLDDLTGHNFTTRMEEGLRKLVLLSCILNREEDHVTEIPQQRLVFFVKPIVQQLRTVQAPSPSGAQMLTILSVVLPPISEIYGSFWSELLVSLHEGGLLSGIDDTLFGNYASLRLLSLFRKSQMQNANDDISESWNESKASIAVNLVSLLKRLADLPDESHQPRRTVNDLLGRLLTDPSISVEVDEQELYPVLASESATLQETAYELSHRHIPSIQEQISVDKALSQDCVAQLPNELLSLILTAPTITFLAETDFTRTMPSTLRSYLLSWKLAFDHWQNASYKVQADYAAALQEGSYVQSLLSLALYVLVDARAKPVDASKYTIESYDPGFEESPEKESHWLFIHLYYLCLRCLPSSTKAWWRDTASRQLNITVGSWTEKYFSPLIIASELATISDWAPSQANIDQPITVKTSLPAREITASIPVDERTMTIAVHLPKSYPLTRAEVTTVHRVGVAEKKWNSWLINTQGVINFSSGSAGEGNAIIDGLMAWRKNVTATMRGQTECAICYSVVGADRQLPNKKCQTCKNTFHSSCLFRWFKSSNSSSCPLCRNAFHYS